MFSSKAVTRFITLSLIVLFNMEVIFPVQIIAQTLLFPQEKMFAQENFTSDIFLKQQKGDLQIIEIRRPTNLSEFKKLQKIDKAEFQKLVSNSQVRIITDKTIAISAEENRKIQTSNQNEFAKIYAKRPDLVDLLVKNKGEKNPEITIGKGKTFSLINGDAMIRDLLLMKNYLESSKNQGQIYDFLYKKFDTQSKNVSPEGISKFKSLPTPAKVVELPTAQISQAIIQITRLWLDYFNTTKETTPSPKSCKDEEGTGNNGDSGEPCGEFNPNGLQSKVSWALKNYNTCIRDQGRRGTCSAFGMTAAVESAIAVKYGRFVNLSEQDLYKKQKLEWFPNPLDFYGDGDSPAFSGLSQMITGYKYPFEKSWDYNKSLKRCRLDIDADGDGNMDKNPLCDQERRYRRSCENYNNVNCSDTNHQSHKRTYRVETKVVKEVVTNACHWVEGNPLLGLIGNWACENITSFIEEIEEVEVYVYDTNISGTSGFQVTSTLPFYAPIIDAQTGIDQAKAFLSSKTPIIFCFTTADSFRAATINGGYVNFDPNETTKSKGHCVLMTGFIDNKDLPRGIKPGDGGGYFIIKNSWGCIYGDQGYAYLPYSWVKKWGTEMVAITGIN